MSKDAEYFIGGTSCFIGGKAPFIVGIGGFIGGKALYIGEVGEFISGKVLFIGGIGGYIGRSSFAFRETGFPIRQAAQRG
ncbi:hypothetical protein FZC78_02460 [Rossellomorea vietnamensis]|uniref:Uncharacterized protein n=1 Tax=Rossellomorea vietnamensis TaxID=218284 RepID=A0A5D4NZY9_9BACI|nr:hypothetical protein [Rossellomorea vietnamensis]TYS19905.1 hypothetical protein FZC78_02460 [Rossellomorea vietnamensis]